MTWHSSLALEYSAEVAQGPSEAGRAPAAKTIARFVHNGPLRVLKSLYPEGDAICHTVLVHPPGGLAGGDRLAIDVSVAPGAHGLITTPSATRFYRSDGEAAIQHTRLHLKSGARLEWLPLESIAHPGCVAFNRLTLQLDPGAEMMGWDVTALGLPHSGQAFDRGSYCQHIEMPGTWLERGLVDAADWRLRQSPVGLAGHTCMASLFFAAGSDMSRTRRAQVLDVARQMLLSHGSDLPAGATSPNPRVVVVRVLAGQVEPAMDLLKQVWSAWRTGIWAIANKRPRIWSM